MKNRGSNPAKRQYVTVSYKVWPLACLGNVGGGGVGREFDMRMNLKS